MSDDVWILWDFKPGGSPKHAFFGFNFCPSLLFASENQAQPKPVKPVHLSEYPTNSSNFHSNSLLINHK